MKKLMKKKVSLFGKEFSVFALVAVCMIGLASAALVPYLSGMVIGTFGVESPFEAKILEGNQTLPNYGALVDGPLTMASVKGGEVVTVTVGFQSLTDEPIDVIEKFVISSDSEYEGQISGFSCEDFESINWYTCTNDCSIWKDIQELDMETECDDSSGDIVISAHNHYDGKELNMDMIELTMKPNALGTYTFDAQIVPAL